MDEVQQQLSNNDRAMREAEASLVEFTRRYIAAPMVTART